MLDRPLRLSAVNERGHGQFDDEVGGLRAFPRRRDRRLALNSSCVRRGASMRRERSSLAHSKKISASSRSAPRVARTTWRPGVGSKRDAGTPSMLKRAPAAGIACSGGN